MILGEGKHKQYSEVVLYIYICPISVIITLLFNVIHVKSRYQLCLYTNNSYNCNKNLLGTNQKEIINGPQCHRILIALPIHIENHDLNRISEYV